MCVGLLGVDMQENRWGSVMTHYLRHNTNTVVDVESHENDLHCVVCIDGYSRLLLAKPDRRHEIIADFSALQELRGEWHEQPKQDEMPSELAERRLREIGNKYGLQYVTD